MSCPLVIDRLIPLRRAAWIAVPAVALASAAACYLAPLIRSNGVAEARDMVAFAIFWFSLLAAALTPVVVCTSGRWTFDDRGVSYERGIGSPRYLRWSDVQKLRWSPVMAVLRGPHFSIPIRFHNFSRDQRRPAFGFVMTQLASHFDLTYPSRPRVRVTPRLALQSLFRISALTVPISALLVGLRTYCPLSTWTMGVLYGTLSAMTLSAFVFVWTQDRRLGNPNRWRTPRSLA